MTDKKEAEEIGKSMTGIWSSSSFEVGCPDPATPRATLRALSTTTLDQSVE